MKQGCVLLCIFCPIHTCIYIWTFNKETNDCIFILLSTTIRVLWCVRTWQKSHWQLIFSTLDGLFCPFTLFKDAVMFNFVCAWCKDYTDDVLCYRHFRGLSNPMNDFLRGLVTYLNFRSDFELGGVLVWHLAGHSLFCTYSWVSIYISYSKLKQEIYKCNELGIKKYSKVLWSYVMCNISFC